LDRYERIFALHRTLAAARRPVPLARLQDELGCSRATLYRDIAFLRDALGAPIESEGDPDAAAIRYAADEESRFELPGLWLNADELHALLATHQLLSQTEPGALKEDLSPLIERVNQLLDLHGGDHRAALDRVRILRTGRRYDAPVFRAVASAVLGRKRLMMRYDARGTGERSERTVSPQRLTFYRDNWYLDAYCHRRESLRSFSVDRIRNAQVRDEPAQDTAEGLLDEHLASSYGIFSGKPRDTAVIRFSAQSARWAAEQHWHRQQQGLWLSDGRYELRVPFGNPTELLMDVMRFGPDAEVVGPASLRAMLRARLSMTMSLYGDGPG
jgi:predicted DNA-binding transcriptional regulator YafY